MRSAIYRILFFMFLGATPSLLSAQSNSVSDDEIEQVGALSEEAIAAYNAGDNDRMTTLAEQMWAIANQADTAPPAWRMSVLRLTVALYKTADQDTAEVFRQGFTIAENEFGLLHEESIDLLAKRISIFLDNGHFQDAYDFGQSWIRQTNIIPRGPEDKFPVELLVSKLRSEGRIAFGDDKRKKHRKYAELAWKLADEARYAPTDFRYNALIFFTGARLLAKLPTLDLNRTGYQFVRDELGADDPLAFRAASTLVDDLIIGGQYQEALIIARESEKESIKAAGEGAFSTERLRKQIALSLMSLGQPDEARLVIEAGKAASVEGLRKQLSELPKGEDDSYLRLQLAELTEPTEAVALLRDLVARQHAKGLIHQVPSTRIKLANLLIEVGETQEAQQQIDLALKYFESDPEYSQSNFYYKALVTNTRLAMLKNPSDSALDRLEEANTVALSNSDTWGESAVITAESALLKFYDDLDNQDARIDMWRDIYLRYPTVATTQADTLSITSDFARVYRIVAAEKTRQPHNGYNELMREMFMRSQGLSSATAQAATLAAARKAASADPQRLAAFQAWETVQKDLEAANRGLSDLAVEQGQISEQQVEEKRQQLISRRDTATKKVDDAFRQLAQIAPEVTDALAPVALSISTLQQDILADDEALLRFAVRPSQNGAIMVWVVTREGMEWSELPFDNGQLQSDILKLRGSLLAGNRGADFFTDTTSVVPAFNRSLAHQLYTGLFGDPAISALLDGKNHWAIVPHQTLFNMPFNALVMDAPKGRDDDPQALRATRWLGLERTISVLPTVSAIAEKGAQSEASQATKQQPFFGVGDPDFQGTDDVSSMSVSRATRARAQTGGLSLEMISTLQRLPGTRTEAFALADLLGGGPDQLLIGEAASEARIQDASERGLLNADVVLFATHGLLAGTFDGVADPALVLTPPKKAAAEPVHLGYTNDGLLTASEVAGLQLDADLVILSACDTAAGIRTGGEGFSGLASAFLSAGASSLLVSHWPVDDRVAVELTTTTVRGRQQDEATNYARALRDAMRSVAMDSSDLRYSHPAYWAPFQFVGAN